MELQRENKERVFSFVAMELQRENKESVFSFVAMPYETQSKERAAPQASNPHQSMSSFASSPSLEQQWDGSRNDAVGFAVIQSRGRRPECNLQIPI